MELWGYHLKEHSTLEAEENKHIEVYEWSDVGLHQYGGGDRALCCSTFYCNADIMLHYSPQPAGGEQSQAAHRLLYRAQCIMGVVV